MRVRLLPSVFALSTLLLANGASAHFDLLEPAPSTDSENGGKGSPPCGPDSSSAVVTPVTGGSSIMVRVNETVPHPGHYRIALAIKSRDELDPSKGGLKEPVVKNMAGMVLTPITGPGDSASAEIQNPPVFPVLADGAFAHTSGGGMFMTSVTLPNVNCERCTLQVIEFMAKHGPDYFYRHCADLKITADPGKPIFDPGGMGGAGGSGGAGGMAGSSATGGAGNGAGGSATTGGSASGMAGTAAGGAATGGVTASAGAPGVAGTAAATAGTGASAPADASDEGGCAVAPLPAKRGTVLSLLAGLVLGLAGFARRRNRAE